MIEPYKGQNKNALASVAATKENPKWDRFTNRLSPL